MTYGTVPTSFLAIRSVQKLAEDGSISHPLGAKVVLRDFYVDDLVIGASTLNEALKIKFQTITLLQDGGFELRKWFSNSLALCDDVLVSNKVIDLGSKHYKTRALGISWKCGQDTFNFANFDKHQVMKKLTKRNILSRIALIFGIFGSCRHNWETGYVGIVVIKN